MGLGKGRHLGEVGHTKNLALSSQGGQLSTHGQGRGTADSRVDLVEHQHRRPGPLGAG